MKEKIIEILHNLVLADDLATTWKIKCHKSATNIDQLINQEVEKRIAERLPTKGESHKKIFELCAMPDNLGKGLRGVISAPMKYEIFDEWIRSRLTNPGNSQKTEGGGE